MASVNMSIADAIQESSSTFGTGSSTMRPGIFGPRPEEGSGRGISNEEKAGMDAFRTLKPICVPIMGIAKITPGNYHQALNLLAALHSALCSLDESCFNASLIQYALFPLVQLIKRNNPVEPTNLPSVAIPFAESSSPPAAIPDRILEMVFHCITVLVEAWKRAPSKLGNAAPASPFGQVSQGIDIKYWEQFWVLVVLVLGGPLELATKENSKGTNASNKGKGKENWSEETQLAGLGLLQALLGPYDPASSKNTSQDEDFFPDIGDDHDWTTLPPPAHPPRSHIHQLYTSSLLQPILFHSVSTLLDLASPPCTNRKIQLQALVVLRIIVNTYFAKEDKVEMLATVMPGIVSGAIKVINDDQKRRKGEVCRAATDLVRDVIKATLGDSVLRDRGVLKSRVTNLEDLMNDIDRSTEKETQIAGLSSASEKGKKPTPFPALTSQYLSFTSTQLVQALKGALPILSTHDSVIVRQGAAMLCATLLGDCADSLPSAQGLLLSYLLRLTQDPFDEVAKEARLRLSTLMSGDQKASTLGKIRELLDSSMNAFPSAIISSHADKHKIINVTSLIIAIARNVTDIMTGGELQDKLFGHLLGSNGNVKKWGWHLLTCLELSWDTVASGSPQTSGVGVTSFQALESRLSQMRITADDATGVPASLDSSLEKPFPEIPLRYVESEEVLRQVKTMLEVVGQAAGPEATFAIDFFAAVARAKRNTAEAAKASAALWVVERLLRGVASGRQVKDKDVRKMARSVAKMLITFDEEDEFMPDASAMSDEEDEDEGTSSGALVPVERTKGMQAVSLLGKDREGQYRTSDRQARRTRRLHITIHRAIVRALSLSTLTACAEILSASFRPLLLSSLYIILSHLGSPTALTRTYAEIALDRIAYHTAYASVRNMIMENVDYVINIVSQRLTYRRLSPLAPMVLISMINLVGEPIVPLVQDVVDDIFEALDDYHGYEMLCSIMLAVLDTLMKAMIDDSDVARWQSKPPTALQLAPPPDPAKDMSRLKDWIAERKKLRRTKDAEGGANTAPPIPWGSLRDKDMDDEPNPNKDEQDIPPTRSQAVCKKILERSIPFLTHSSPFIRARVLSLMASGVPVLVVGGREGDLLPLINRMWPYILNRLKDKEPYVVEAAAGMIECLARWVGDFMSKRIMENAWPTFKILLEAQKKLDEKSALVRTGRRQTGPMATYMVSHRLHLSILNAMKYIAAEVPVQEDTVWEITLMFRYFLDSASHIDLQEAAVELYRKLAYRDEDLVWLVLHATMGELPGNAESTRYLSQPGLDIKASVEKILRLHDK